MTTVTRFLIVTIAVLLLGCKSAFAQVRDLMQERAEIAMVKVEFDSTLDRFTGVSTIKDRKPLHTATVLDGGDRRDRVWFMVYRVSKGGDREFYAYIYYAGPDWAFLNGTIQLLLDDGQGPAEIAGENPNRDVISCAGRCLISEGFAVRIPELLLLRLASASSVEVRVTGSKQSFDRSFKKEHHALVRAMVSRYLLVTDP